MTYDDILQARNQFISKNKKSPTILNINEADAVKLLSSLVGRGTLPANKQQEAVKALDSKANVLTFFKDAKLAGMTINVYPTVE